METEAREDAMHGRGGERGGESPVQAGPRRRGMWPAAYIRRSLYLYAVTERSGLWNSQLPLPAAVEAAIRGGASFVQLREKHATADEIRALAGEILPICRAAGVPFVIDDEVELALEVGADGVHVGQSDMACAAAREKLGPNKIVGVSAQTVEEALAAQAAGADYLGVGALYPTPTKPDAVDVTFGELARICAAVDIPVVGIGGLHASTVAPLAGTGVAGAAVVSDLFSATDPETAARTLAAELHRVLG